MSNLILSMMISALLLCPIAIEAVGLIDNGDFYDLTELVKGNAFQFGVGLMYLFEMFHRAICRLLGRQISQDCAMHYAYIHFFAALIASLCLALDLYLVNGISAFALELSRRRYEIMVFGTATAYSLWHLKALGNVKAAA